MGRSRLGLMAVLLLWGGEFLGLGAEPGPAPVVGPRARPPQFSVTRGIFDQPFSVSLSAPADGAVIRYTTDGSEPAPNSGKIYVSSLRITNTTILRARTFSAGLAPSRLETHSYLFLDGIIRQSNNPPGFPAHWGLTGEFPEGHVPADYEMDRDPLRADPGNPESPLDPVKVQRYERGLRELPLVSLVLAVGDMFGDGGLYASAREAHTKTANEKPCSVEMLLPDGQAAFAVTCSIDLHGNASRNPLKNPKHGFKLAFKTNYGPAELRYPLFPDSPATRFDDLILRPDFGVSWRHWSDSPHNDNGGRQRTRAVRFRDAWLKNTFRDMGHVASYNRFCHLFINGLYWGVYDFTEQPTDSFGRNYFGGRKADYEVFDQGILRRGERNAFLALLRLSNLGNPANYEAARRLLDLPEFIDYTLLHFFVGHQDWGRNKNWYAVRNRVTTPPGTFKFIPWDGENLLLDEDIDRVSDPDVPGGLHRRLLESPEYQLAFADRVFKHMLTPRGALTQAANLVRWRKWQALLDKPIVAESMRWGDYRRDVHPFFDGLYALYTRENHWLAENARITDSYFAQRNAIVLKQLRAAGLYPAIAAPAFTPAGGKIPPQLVLAMSASQGAIYFTTNGTDPREFGTGAVSPNATVYRAPVALAHAVTLKARARSGRTWSALHETHFEAAD